jgi:hypothetical protein
MLMGEGFPLGSDWDIYDCTPTARHRWDWAPS